MKRAHWRSAVALMTVVMLGSALGGLSRDAASALDELETVRVEDIPRKVRIIGRCGKPLGDLLSIRGTWRKPGGPKLESDPLRFRVDSVDGIELVSTFELQSWQVVPIPLGHVGGRVPKPEESWDWHFDWTSDAPPPARTDGDCWEILAVETGRFDYYSPAVVDEVGGVGRQKPTSDGFIAQLEFIAVRRVSGD